MSLAALLRIRMAVSWTTLEKLCPGKTEEQNFSNHQKAHSDAIFFTSFLNDKYFKSTWDLTAQCQFKSKLLIPIISVNQINIVCKMINLYTLSI